MSQLTQLRTLDLSNNRLKSLPLPSLAQLPMLHTVKLTGNADIVADDSTISTLREIVKKSAGEVLL